MKYNLTSIALSILLLVSVNSYAQSIFTTEEEVAEYLIGEWNLDVLQGGFAGGTYYPPTPIYYDSTFHRIIFEASEIDSTPLICKAYINDTLYQTTYVSISENPLQIILPRWLLNDMPENLDIYSSIAESEGFYGFSQDTMVLGNNGADGFAYGFSRLSTSTNELDPNEDVTIYPNPSDGELFISGIEDNTPFQLYTLDGKIVKEGRISLNTFNIEVNGVFILKIKLMAGWIAKKIVVSQ